MSVESEPIGRMPAEWEPHAATWLAWPHEASDWPGKFESIPWVYTEIVRHLAASERVEVLCRDEAHRADTAEKLAHAGVQHNVRLHVVPTDRSWVRDSGATAVRASGGALRWVSWSFNAWAKYPNFHQDREVPGAMARLTGIPLIQALRADGSPFVAEGGGIETDGAGTLLVTEECFLSDLQCRNPGLGAADYEALFKRYLGIEKTIWLGRGCAGDDTHGHIDDIARFVGPRTVALAVEEDPNDENFEASRDNLRRLQLATDAGGRSLDVVQLPMPAPVVFDGVRLPASYANFYIANTIVLVPTFNEAKDRSALELLSKLFPDRRVVGIHAVDLVWGLGTLHCLSQQQPA